MRVLVCGGRDWKNYEFLATYLKTYFFDTPHPGLKSYNDVTIIHGGANGADKQAETWANYVGLKTENYPANWKQYRKAAGAIRNQQMLDTGIDVVIAFPGGRGTADMVRRAKRAGIEVIEVSYDPA